MIFNVLSIRIHFINIETFLEYRHSVHPASFRYTILFYKRTYYAENFIAYAVQPLASTTP